MKESPSDERYRQLAEKWLNGTITPAEQQEYPDWYNTIGPDEQLEIPAAMATSRESHRNKILQQINQQRKPVVRLFSPIFKRVAAAAIFLLVLGGSYFYFLRKPQQSPAIANIISPQKMDIPAGTNGAVLTLANGQKIVLDTAKNGKLLYSAGTDVTKSDGSLTIAGNTGEKNEVEYYTLSTPRARQQQLTLADGTQVWLNAESSIKFPNTFPDAQREVEITGEAYFEVAKNAAQPFIVKVNDATVKVLGTHFDIMAYPNENALQTTLLEGAVLFSKGNSNMALKPGQQSQLLATGQLKLLDNVDLDQVVAWKNGMQAFNRADIKTIMRQVERWYDVDVEYKGYMPNRTFTGDISRSANLSEVLKIFEVSKIHFQIDPEHRKLTVLP